MKFQFVSKRFLWALPLFCLFSGCFFFESTYPLPTRYSASDIENLLGVWSLPDGYIHLKITKNKNNEYFIISQGIETKENEQTKKEETIGWGTDTLPASAFTKIGEYMFLSAINGNDKYVFYGLKKESPTKLSMKQVGGKLFKNKDDDFIDFKSQEELYSFFKSNYMLPDFWDGDGGYLEKITENKPYDDWINSNLYSICYTRYGSYSFKSANKKLVYEILNRGNSGFYKTAVVRVFSPEPSNKFEFYFTLKQGDSPVFFLESTSAQTYSKQKAEEDSRRKKDEAVLATVGGILLLGILGSFLDDGNNNSGSNSNTYEQPLNQYRTEEKKKTQCSACGGSGEIWVSVPYYNRITEQSGYENKARTCSRCGGMGSY